MLGWAGEITGRKFATPVFDGATPSEVQKELENAGLPATGKALLIDGKLASILIIQLQLEIFI